MTKTILITGGCGFIGHHLCEAVIKNTNWNIKIIDKLSYASAGFNRLKDINVYDDSRINIFTHDVTKPITECLVEEIGDIDYISHLSAYTHVDNSITNPRQAVLDNVLGTMEMLEFARLYQPNLKLFNYFSTDEIFGPAPEGIAYKEWDRLNPTNPYSAGKAGGDAIALAYANTYGIPVYITNTMNAYGERQHPEKYIPKIINCVLNEQKLTIHSDPTMTKAGSRFYIHCRNIADAVLFLIDKSETQTNYKLRDKFNIVGEKEIDNLELAQLIASIIDKPLKYEMVDFHGSRPGHDLRYALDGTKMKELGWEPPKSFEESLEKTVRWYLEPNNKKWLEI